MNSINYRKKELILGIVAIVCAAAIGFGLLPFYVNRQNDTSQVVVTNQAVTEGTQLSSEHLKLKTVRTIDILDGSMTKIEDAVGKYILSDIPAGDYITQAKITDSIANSEKAAIMRATSKGYRTVSFEMPNLAASVSAILRPGDLVSVMIYTENLTTVGSKLGATFSTNYTEEDRNVIDVDDSLDDDVEDSLQQYYDSVMGGSVMTADSDITIRYIVATGDLESGHILTREDLEYKTETIKKTELSYYSDALARVDELIGKSVTAPIESGDLLYLNNVVLSEIPKLLEFVEVASLHVSNAAPPNEAETTETKSTVPYSVTFYMTEEQLISMNEYIENSNCEIRLIFVARDQDREAFVKAEKLVMESTAEKEDGTTANDTAPKNKGQ